MDTQYEHMELAFVKYPHAFLRESMPVAVVATGLEESFTVQFLVSKWGQGSKAIPFM